MKKYSKFCVLPMVAFLSMTIAAHAQSAHYSGAVQRYGHNILGATPEWSKICFDDYCQELPENEIFEDIAPLEADLNGDQISEYITVISQIGQGASLAIFDHELNKIAQTPFIGTQNRWLAPIGAADFNNDGKTDIAYVETPHIGGVLKIWTFENSELVQTHELKGVSNHKIGDDFIRSEIRNCGEGYEILVPNQAYSRIFAVGFSPEDNAPYAFPIDEFSEDNWQNRNDLPCPLTDTH